jgi:D-beta-D-heptose 7-phosphate kinase/D-beta-D-heptose 1-phosphate adenosyltransferase
LSDHTLRAPVVSAAEAAGFADSLREQGKRIVFTNGCFDLFHPGHLEILEKARMQGDFLFVGVNTDDSVKRLKGPARPVQPLESRVAVLSGLRSVDCVVPFSQDTPLELIRGILPDVLVKGGDYSEEQVVGADVVTENHGDVVIVPLKGGYSTTLIIQKMS